MTVDFPQGVPDGCIIWLHKHVGIGGNSTGADTAHFKSCAWYYERRFEPYNAADNEKLSWGQGSHIPSITVKDLEKAVLFALRWSGQ